MHVLIFASIKSKAMAKKPTYFNNDWIDPALSPDWCNILKPVTNDPTKAYCKLCRKAFGLSNMGRQAIISHVKSKIHQKNIVLTKSNMKMQCFIQQTPAVVDAQMVAACRPIVETSDVPRTASEINASSGSCTELKPMVETYVSKENVTAAEILWCMNLVMNRMSFNSCAIVNELFKRMFSDSDIAKKFALASTKASYFVCYGMAPYFHTKLLDLLKRTKFVACFDESLNKIAQRGQMDIVVRFWNKKTETVDTRYLKSVFMGHATANDILEKFKEGLEGLDLSLLMQVSMDGPNVNHKFLAELKENLTKLPEDPELLDLGSCGLHVLHGSLQTGHKAAGWHVHETLRGMHMLFNNTPARRADYISITESNVFPIKFCQTRWVENAKVANKAIEVFPQVKNYIQSTKRLPNNITCTNVKRACEDTLTLPKLAFFSTVASVLEPFLNKYQTAEPMVPFLYGDVYEVMYVLMTKCVKSKVLEKNSGRLTKINLKDEENLLPVKLIDIGFATKKELGKSKAKDIDKLAFLNDCRKFLIATIMKIIERSPLKFNLAKAAACLDPKVIDTDPKLALKKMNDLLQVLHDKNQLESTAADKAKVQFSRLMLDTDFKEKIKEFCKAASKKRLDTFFHNEVGQRDNCSELWVVMKHVFILSHGNACVESGFSINKELLVENLHESSLIAQRQVYDGIKAEGGVMSVDINAAMLRSVRASSSRYKTSLEEKKTARTKEQLKVESRKRAKAQINMLEAKKKKIEVASTIEQQSLDKEISSLRKLT